MTRAITQESWLLRLVTVVATGLLSGACAAQAGPVSPTPEANGPSESLVQTDQGQGGVTVQATWITPAHLQEMAQASLSKYSIEQYALVHVLLDTHSVDLVQYDLARLAELVLQGEVVAPAAWVGLNESSHHRDGVFVFPRPVGEYKSAQMRLKDIANTSERVFRWEF